MDLGGLAIEKTTGKTEDQIRAAYEAGRQKVVAFLQKYDGLAKNGGHELISRLLALAGVNLDDIQAALQKVANAGSDQQVQDLVRELSGNSGFERTPLGLFLESAVGPAIGVLANTDTAKQLKSLSEQALAVLDGDTLQKLLTFIRTMISTLWIIC
jgi:hypothetical protein